MVLTKAHIVGSVQNQLGFPKKTSSELVECVKEKKERKGRNPATGEDMMLESRKVVTFKCSGKLRDKINS
jgi:integration host factor subunit alpha